MVTGTERMKNWLRQKLINILVDTEPSRSSVIGRGNVSISLGNEVCDDSSSSIDLPDPITFKVQAVSGGTVVESRWYDYKKDENRVKLHIITQEENLSESIGKIVTMELLQK
jgi:hypothetical protein